MSDILKRAATKTKKKRWRTVLNILGVFIALGIGSAACTLGYLYMTDLPESQLQQSSELLDRSGKPLALLASGQTLQQSVSIQDIAPALVQATLATEDRKFYNHFGIDIYGIARAAVVNLEHLSTKQGASTLTQQLARNMYLTHERTWKRKAKEALFALQLEMKHSKDDILAMYLNQIYYGHGAYGIESAARMYFGKSAKELVLAESAMLAGIPRGPSYYSPWINMKNAKDRQKIVLQNMVETGAIQQHEADVAYNATLRFRTKEERSDTLVAPYFRDYVRKELYALGLTEDEIESGGLRIYTTLDARAQAAAEAAVAKNIPSSGDLQAALVSIDPRSGDIKAMVGGKNYRENQFNRVFANTRQPGSAFKPIVYLTALEQKQLTAASRFTSQPTSFSYDEGRKTYSPSNFGGKYYGDIDLRQAIAASDNIFAVNTIMQIGPDKVIEMAKRLGIHADMKPVPSLALGTYPVSPYEMASVYAVLSNDGNKMMPRAVLAVTDRTGRVIYQAATLKPVQIVDSGTTYVLTNLMESVFEAGGTGNRVSSLIKRPVAGKTGTTDSDSWIVGYTPELSTAVWVGYDKGKTITTTDAHLSAPIFAEYTEKALESVPPKLFTIPDSVVSVYIDSDSGKLAGEGCVNKRLETFVRGTEPTEWCGLHPGGNPPEQKQPEGKPADATEKQSWWRHLKRWWTG
ncbi:PBP1A family penicillin-binding protein [Paenibacillus sp. ACRRX]|uniref:transglycosylase domain-containing protein n=1 Tax=Paenibacillus sp. ACRRX TaxID=2918206 RepID=UPI001EF69350|nr:PBP1A family penicillin-binding protein [Paenibacillus sp. ACRRX]MCG7410715.1 PBP1A family penicillin-binding protein [Paenibacillus sp. ACRRX]